jgi:hypothetical protein
MSAARTNAIDSLQAAAQPTTKPAANPSPGQESFRSRWQSELTTPEDLAKLASGQTAAKNLLAQLASDKSGVATRAGLNSSAENKAAIAAKDNAAARKSDATAADSNAHAKSKAKQIAKAAKESALLDGAGALAATAAAGVQTNIVPVAMQTAGQSKKEVADTSLTAIKNVPSTAGQPLDAAVSGLPAPAAGTASDQVSALESKSKHSSASSIAGLVAKPATGIVSAEGLLANAGGVNGIAAVGGVAGQALQGGHSSGASGKNDSQPSPGHATAGTPQLIASSPAQLDVGVYDDTHGWLRIRAELGTGGAVNATLTSADAAHESLRTALPAMTHYLGAESVNVSSIELHKFGDAPSGQPSHAEGQQQGSAGGQQSRGDEQQPANVQAHMVAALEDTASQSVAAVTSSPIGVGVEASTPASASIVGAGDSTFALAADVQGTDASKTDTLSTQVLPWQVGFAGSGGWVNVSA